MKAITTIDELELAIQLLEEKRDLEKSELKEHLRQTVESFRPVNIIKDTFSEIVHSKDLKSDITKVVIGSLTGYLAKQAVIGETKSSFSKIMGVILEMVVAKNVIQNSDQLKTMGQNLLKKILHPNHNSKE